MTDDAYGLCIPTLNPGRWVHRLAAAIAAQRPRPVDILVIDSSSDDGSLDALTAVGARIVTIQRRDFDHGGTRAQALDLIDAPSIVYLTQDAIPLTSDALDTLVQGLNANSANGLAFGRQVARPGARAATRAHRELLYPAASRVATPEDIPRLGVEASFASNAFAAYRRSALEEIGRFATGIVSHEDRWAAGRMLLAGWNIAYVADAAVEHSHDYAANEQFRRYFDAGAFEATNPWFRDSFGRPHGRGRELVTQQVRAAQADGGAREMARVIAHSALALAGHQAGVLHERLPLTLQRRLTMNPAYFARQQ